MRRKLFALGVAAVVAVAGCSSPGHHDPLPTTTSQLASGGPNPDVIPPVITVAYVNAVFAALDQVNGDAIRLLLASHAVTPAVDTDLRAIFNDPLYGEEVRIAQQTVGADLSNVRPNPGDRAITVRKLITASASCIFVETVTDLSHVLRSVPKPASAEYYALRPKQSGADPEHLNDTPWAIAFNATYLTPTTIPNQCVGNS